MSRRSGVSSPGRFARRHLRISVLAALVAVTGLGIAVAQPEEEETPDEETGEISVQERANLTPAEQLAESRRIQDRGNALSRRVASSLDEARREQDIIRVTCVNDKLTQINANLRTLEQRVENLEAANESGDRSRGNHEFTVILVIGQKLVVLDREAVQCGGEDIFETGATRVDVTIDPTTPTTDPTVIPGIGIEVAPRIPPEASPNG